MVIGISKNYDKKSLLPALRLHTSFFPHSGDPKKIVDAISQLPRVE
jgi:hypothetical protein